MEGGEGENIIYVQVDEHGRVINYTSNMPGGEQVILLQEGEEANNAQANNQLILQQPTPDVQHVSNVVAQPPTQVTLMDPSAHGQATIMDQSGAQILVTDDSQIPVQMISMSNNPPPPPPAPMRVQAASLQVPAPVQVPHSAAPIILSAEQAQILIAGAQQQLQQHPIAKHRRQPAPLQATTTLFPTSPPRVTQRVGTSPSRPGRSLISDATRSILANQKIPAPNTITVSATPTILHVNSPPIVQATPMKSPVMAAPNISSPVLVSSAPSILETASKIITANASPQMLMNTVTQQSEIIVSMVPEPQSAPPQADTTHQAVMDELKAGNEEEVVCLDEAKKVSESDEKVADEQLPPEDAMSAENIEAEENLSQAEKDMLDAAKLEKERADHPELHHSISAENQEEQEIQELSSSENERQISVQVPAQEEPMEVENESESKLEMPEPNIIEDFVPAQESQTISSDQGLNGDIFANEEEDVTEKAEPIREAVNVQKIEVTAPVVVTAPVMYRQQVESARSISVQPPQQITQVIERPPTVVEVPKIVFPPKIIRIDEPIAPKPPKSDDLGETLTRIMELSNKFDSKFKELETEKQKVIEEAKQEEAEEDAKTDQLFSSLKEPEPEVVETQPSKVFTAEEFMEVLADEQTESEEQEQEKTQQRTEDELDDEDIQFTPKGVGRPKKTYEGFAIKRVAASDSPQKDSPKDVTLSQPIAERRGRRKSKPVVRDFDDSDMEINADTTDDTDSEQLIIETPTEKRGRGRPRKYPTSEPSTSTSAPGSPLKAKQNVPTEKISLVGRGRGRAKATADTSSPKPGTSSPKPGPSSPRPAVGSETKTMTGEKRGRGRPKKTETIVSSSEQQPDVTSSSDQINDADPQQKSFMANFKLMTAAQRAAQEEERKRRKSKRVSLAEQKAAEEAAAKEEENKDEQKDNIFDIIQEPKKVDAIGAIESLRSDVDDLRDVNSQLLSKLSSSEETDVKTLQNKINKLQTVNSELKTRLREVENKTASSKFTERTEIKALQTKCDKLHGHNKDLKAKINDFDHHRSPTGGEKKSFAKIKGHKFGKLSFTKPTQAEKTSKSGKAKQDLEAWEAQIKLHSENVEKKEQKLKSLDRELDERMSLIKGKEGKLSRALQLLKAKEKELEYREKQVNKGVAATASNQQSDFQLEEKAHQLTQRDSTMKDKERDLQTREQLLIKTEQQMQALGKDLKEKFEYLQNSGQDVSVATAELDAKLAHTAAQVKTTTSAALDKPSTSTVLEKPPTSTVSPAKGRKSLVKKAEESPAPESKESTPQPKKRGRPKLINTPTTTPKSVGRPKKEGTMKTPVAVNKNKEVKSAGKKDRPKTPSTDKKIAGKKNVAKTPSTDKNIASAERRTRRDSSISHTPSTSKGETTTPGGKRGSSSHSSTPDVTQNDRRSVKRPQKYSPSPDPSRKTPKQAKSSDTLPRNIASKLVTPKSIKVNRTPGSAKAKANTLKTPGNILSAKRKAKSAPSTPIGKSPKPVGRPPKSVEKAKPKNVKEERNGASVTKVSAKMKMVRRSVGSSSDKRATGTLKRGRPSTSSLPLKKRKL